MDSVTGKTNDYHLVMPDVSLEMIASTVRMIMINQDEGYEQVANLMTMPLVMIADQLGCPTSMKYPDGSVETELPLYVRFLCSQILGKIESDRYDVEIKEEFNDRPA